MAWYAAQQRSQDLQQIARVIEHVLHVHQQPQSKQKNTAVPEVYLVGIVDHSHSFPRQYLSSEQRTCAALLVPWHAVLFAQPIGTDGRVSLHKPINQLALDA